MFTILLILAVTSHRLEVTECATSETRDIFLNSYTNCGHDKTFEVSPRVDYLIMPDGSPNTKTMTFRTCEVTFHSHRSDGHLCLMQVGNVGKIMDPNIDLEVRDGLGNSGDLLIQHLQSYPQTWQKREYCTTSRYITFYMREIDDRRDADIRKVQLTFHVVDMSSPKRTLYLDGDYCNMDYLLLNSEVSLINRPQFPGMVVKTLTSECSMAFKKLNAASNSTICMAYIPSSSVSCDSHWRFAISSAYFEPDEKHFVYSLRCNDFKSKEIHVWCGEKEIQSVTVIYWRDNNIYSNSTVESSGVFRYLIMDYEGSAESLLNKVKASLAYNSVKDHETIWIGVGIGALLIVLARSCL